MTAFIKFSSAFLLFAFGIPCEAQVTEIEAKRFSSELTFGSVKTFNDARTRLKARADAASYLMSYLQEKALLDQVSAEITKLLPQVQKALPKGSKECALLSVTVDSSSNGTATAYRLRHVLFEGIGDSAVHVLAPKVLSEEKIGSISAGPPRGYFYDDKMSHLICIGYDGDELKASEVYMPLVRSSLAEAVKKLREQEAQKGK